MKTLPHYAQRKIVFATKLAFFITIILIPFRARFVLFERPVYQVYKDFTDFLLFASDISTIFLLLFWGLSLLSFPRHIKMGTKFVWMPLLGLLSASFLSVFSSLDWLLSLYYSCRLFVLFGFYLYVVNEVNSPISIITAIIFQTAVQSAVALGQFFFQSSLGLQILGEHTLDPAVKGVSVVFDGATRLLRAYGLTEHPNILGGCLAFCLIVLLAVYMDGEKQMRRYIVFLFLAGLLALFVTFSRSAWLAFAAGVLVLLGAMIVLRRGDAIKSFILLGLVSAIMLAPFVWTNRAFLAARVNIEDSFEKNDIESHSIDERRFLNDAAFHIFAIHPLTGTGLGSSSLAIKKYYEKSFNNYLPPHFSFLAAAMETGIFGAGCYLFLMLFPWFVLAKCKMKLLGQPVLVTTYALLLAMTVVSVLDIYPWLLTAGRLWQWLIWGLLALVYEKVALNKL